MSVGTRSASKDGFPRTLCAGPSETMTLVTPCQTKHNIPAIRETVGAAVHAAARTTAIRTRTGTVATNVVTATRGKRTPIDPRSFVRKDRVRRVAKCP